MTLATRGASECFGAGTWTAYVTARGGSPVRFDLDYSSISQNKVVNAGGSARLSVPNTGTEPSPCCQMLYETEPWRDELMLLRGNELAYAGPVQSLSASLDGGTLQSQDLFGWLEQRWLPDFHGDGDAADIFAALFQVAYSSDETPNISIVTRPTGVEAIRDYLGTEFQRAADAMRELARTALDFTMDGRTILAGGVEVFETTTPLVLHDEGCLWAEVSRDGADFATDVAVFGSTSEAGGTSVSGRASRSADVYGLIQRSYTELLIRDSNSADANALARLESMQPAPLRVRASLSDQAAFGFGDLVCGRRVDVRLREAAGCVAVEQVMRLESVDVSVNAGDTSTEEVVINLVPLGVSDA